VSKNENNHGEWRDINHEEMKKTSELAAKTKRRTKYRRAMRRRGGESKISCSKAENVAANQSISKREAKAGGCGVSGAAANVAG